MTSRDSTTRWSGTLQEGHGDVTFDSSNAGQFEISLPTRAAEKAPDGKTSPEELLAAALSSCLAMNTAGTFGAAGISAESIDVSAEVFFGPDPAGGYHVPKIEVTLRARIPGLDAERFAELAAQAHATCPVSKALAATRITLDAALED